MVRAAEDVTRPSVGQHTIRFRGLASEHSELRASFEITIGDTEPPFDAHVVLHGRFGNFTRLHVSDGPTFDDCTTGSTELDNEVVERAREEVARARAAALIVSLERGRRSR